MGLKKKNSMVPLPHHPQVSGDYSGEHSLPPEAMKRQTHRSSSGLLESGLYPPPGSIKANALQCP